MMAGTYVPIESVTLSADTAAIEFTSIPQTFTDLVIRMTLRAGQPSSTMSIWFGDLSGAMQSATNLTGSGASASSGRQTTSWYTYLEGVGTNQTGSGWGSAEIYVPNYSGTTSYKPFSGFGVQEANVSTSVWMQAQAGLRNSNTAISYLKVLSNSGQNFLAGSQIHLYGIKNS